MKPGRVCTWARTVRVRPRDCRNVEKSRGEGAALAAATEGAPSRGGEPPLAGPAPWKRATFKFCFG